MNDICNHLIFFQIKKVKTNKVKGLIFIIILIIKQQVENIQNHFPDQTVKVNQI